MLKIGSNNSRFKCSMTLRVRAIEPEMLCRLREKLTPIIANFNKKYGKSVKCSAMAIRWL